MTIYCKTPDYVEFQEHLKPNILLKKLGNYGLIAKSLGPQTSMVKESQDSKQNFVVQAMFIHIN